MKSMAAAARSLTRAKDNRNEFTVLRRNVESAEKAYDTAMQRHVVSQVKAVRVKPTFACSIRQPFRADFPTQRSPSTSPCRWSGNDGAVSGSCC